MSSNFAVFHVGTINNEQPFDILLRYSLHKHLWQIAISNIYIGCDKKIPENRNLNWLGKRCFSKIFFHVGKTVFNYYDKD